VKQFLFVNRNECLHPRNSSYSCTILYHILQEEQELAAGVGLAWLYNSRPANGKAKALSVNAKAEVNAMTTKVKAHTAKCSYCRVQCWQLTELDFSVNHLLFFSYYYSYSYWLFLSYSYS